MKPLKLVHPKQALPGVLVEIDLSLKGSLLSARFKVRSGDTSVANPALPTGSSQWGLWDWDVVELFVSCSRAPSRLPYYEFQVSPLGQHFELEILVPRVTVNREFRSGFTHLVRSLGPGEWEAELGLPLDRLGWDGDPSSVTGNAYAILGPSAARSYWSLSLEPQDKPDFHLPRLFKPLP